MKPISLKAILSASTLMHAMLASVTVAIGIMAWGVGHQVQAAFVNAGERSRVALDLLAKAERLHAEWKSVQAEQDAATREISDLRAKLPQHAEESNFLQQISNLAAEHHVTISEFRPGSAVKAGDHHEMELRLRCCGEYPNLCRWLAGLERLPRMSRVSQLTVAAPRTADGDCAFDCQIKLLFGLLQKDATSNTVQP